MARIDEGFQQKQRIAEAFLPIPNQAPFAQGEDAGGKIRIVVVGEDQEAAVVGDEMQAIILVAEIPTDPGIPRATLPGGGGEAQQDHPLARPGSDVPQRMTNLRQCPQVMMRLHQALEAFLLESSHRLQMNFAKVQAYGLGQLNVETLYTLATIPCPEPMTTYWQIKGSELAWFRPAPQPKAPCTGTGSPRQGRGQRLSKEARRHASGLGSNERPATLIPGGHRPPKFRYTGFGPSFQENSP